MDVGALLEASRRARSRNSGTALRKLSVISAAASSESSSATKKPANRVLQSARAVRLGVAGRGKDAHQLPRGKATCIQCLPLPSVQRSRCRVRTILRLPTRELDLRERTRLVSSDRTAAKRHCELTFFAHGLPASGKKAATGTERTRTTMDSCAQTSSASCSPLRKL